MNSVDTIVLLLLALAFLIGFRNGFVKSALSFISWIVGIYVAGLFGEKFSIYVKSWFHLSNDLSRIIAFVFIFLIVVVLLNLAARLLTGVLKMLMMGLTNKILGGVFNVLKYIFVLSFILMVVNSTYSYRILSEEDRQKSKLYEPIATIARASFPHIQSNLHEFEMLWKPTELPESTEDENIDSLQQIQKVLKNSEYQEN